MEIKRAGYMMQTKSDVTDRWYDEPDSTRRTKHEVIKAWDGNKLNRGIYLKNKQRGLMQLRSVYTMKIGGNISNLTKIIFTIPDSNDGGG